MKIKTLSVSIFACFCVLNGIKAQSISLDFPIIYSDITVNDNWFPPTAVNGSNQDFHGNSMGYGINLVYTFQPSVFIKDKNLSLSIGIGYFIQRFNVIRPFDYESMQKIIFYTDHYSYYCFQSQLGLSYKYPIVTNYSISGSVFYNSLKSFRQKYKPKWEIGSPPSQVNNYQLDFGSILILGIGVDRQLNQKFLISMDLIVPINTRWRNDRIFKDDPTTFSSPNFSIGTSMRFTYRFEMRK
jgi:hypothetical protein